MGMEALKAEITKEPQDSHTLLPAPPSFLPRMDRGAVAEEGEVMKAPGFTTGAGGVRQEGMSRAVPLPPQMECKGSPN